MPSYKWEIVDASGRPRGVHSTRERAIKIAERMRLPGCIEVWHTSRGERWQRRQGSWFKVAMTKAAS